MQTFDHPKEPSEITPYLSIGDSAHGSHRFLLESLNVTAIINLTKESFEEILIDQRKIFILIYMNTFDADIIFLGPHVKMSIAYHHFPIDDHPKEDISQYFQRTSLIIGNLS